jgi:hypothetical protein
MDHSIKKKKKLLKKSLTELHLSNKRIPRHLRETHCRERETHTINVLFTMH